MRDLFGQSLAARRAGNEQALALLAGVIPERMRLMQEATTHAGHAPGRL